MENIINIETIAHLAWLEKKYPSASVNESVKKTGTVTRPEYNLNYFGVAYEKVELKGGKYTSIEKYISTLGTEDSSKFRKLCDFYGLTKADMVHYKFNIIATPKK